MSLRFRRRVKLLPGVHVNLGLHGAGVSVGRRGLHVGVNRRGVYNSAGIPGTGSMPCTTTAQVSTTRSAVMRARS